MAPTTRTLLLAPMSSELRPLVRQFKATPSAVYDEKVFVAHHGPHEVTMAQLGVGPATARRVTGRLVEAVRPDRVVVSGIAGGGA